MNALRGLGGTAGYIIGAVVILPILLITYNYFFINKNNAGPYINSYIVNSQQIKIAIPPYTGDDIYQFKAITTALATKNMGRSDSRHTDMQFRVVYSPEIKKYFSITMFDIYHKGVDPMEDAFWRVVNKSTIYMQVNNDDLKNPEYGSKDHPIPVFKVWGANSPLTADYGVNNPINYDVSDEQYKYNVMVYLTFVMPKKEFKERFKN